MCRKHYGTYKITLKLAYDNGKLDCGNPTWQRWDVEDSKCWIMW